MIIIEMVQQMYQRKDTYKQNIVELYKNEHRVVEIISSCF